MKRLTAHISGKVQQTGYRSKIVETARALRLKGFAENLDDGRVRILAEGEEEKLKWFLEAIDIKNTLIQVSNIEKEYTPAVGDISKFYKLVDKGETDARLDTAAVLLKELTVAVINMGEKLGSKLDTVIERQDQMIGKQDQMIDLQQDMLDEVKDSRKDLKGYLDQRFAKLEDEVIEMKAALRAKGII